MAKEFDFDKYEERCNVTKEIRDFLKENPMSYVSLIRYARENDKKDWLRAIHSPRCLWLRNYCLDGKYRKYKKL